MSRAANGVLAASRHGVALLVGAAVGALATWVLLGPPNHAEITVVNETASTLALVELTESRFGNRYVARNLAPDASITFPVFAHGELGYRLTATTGSGVRHADEFYAEAGYEVTHGISAEGISYEVSPY